MKFLIHVTCGIESPSKAAMAFLVAKTAIESGHKVSMFLAADSVQLLRPAVIESMVGLGTGAMKDHVAAISAAGAEIYVSGLSAKTRGLCKDDIKGIEITVAMPDVLVKAAAEADRVLCY